MKSNLPFVSLTYSVVLACGLLLGGHESWGQETYCIGNICYRNVTAAVNAINRSKFSGDLSQQQIDSALRKYPELQQALNPATTLQSGSSIDGLAALPPSESLKRINDIAQSYPGNEYNAINGALEQGVISKQDYVDWMNDGLGDPLKGRIQAYGTNLQELVNGGEISQEKADAIAKALGKERPADVTAEELEDFEKKAEEEEKEKKKKRSDQTHADHQEDKDKKDDKKPNNGGCGPGGCNPGGGGGGLGGGGGGGGGLLAGLGQAAMQMLPQLLQGLMQGMLQNQGNQQGLDNQLDQLTQEQLDQNFLNQFVFPTQTAIAQATAFAETATAIAEETAGAEDTSNSNSEEETSEESEATPAPTPTATSNPYHI